MTLRTWNAADADEIRTTMPDEVEQSDDAPLARNLAIHFGYEVRDGMPSEGGYYSVSPGCVFGQWYRKKGATSWECLRCASSYTFDSAIREDWVRRFMRGDFAEPKSQQEALVHRGGHQTEAPSFEQAAQMNRIP